MSGRARQIFGPGRRIALLLFLLLPALLHGESRAVVVAGLSGGAADQQLLQSLAQKTRQGLIARGFPESRIVVLGAPEKAKREAILAALTDARAMKPEDEFWLILLGHGGRGSDGGPLFQIAGPRLEGSDLKTALDAIPARQFVFAGTEDSGAYVPLLLQPNRTVLAATRGEGEINQPRFTEAWVTSLLEGPTDPLPRIAARAAERVDLFYAQNSLARGEHARLGDAVSGKILEAPFGDDPSAAAKPDVHSAPGGPAPLIAASDIDVTIRDPNAEWETHPPTAENRKLIADAAKVPNPEGYAALMLEKRLAYSVDADRTTERVYFHRVYLEREEAVEAWSNYRLPQAPPATTTKLLDARVIRPDGSSTVFNPDKLPTEGSDASGLSGTLATIYLPQVRAGCLVEIAYKTRDLLDATLPEFSAEIPLQESAPVLKTTLLVRVPEKQTFQVRLNNVPGTPAAAPTTENGWKTTAWSLGPIEPLSPLPYDPPQREFAASLGITSFPSWDAFALWYRRLAQGSDIIDDSVRKKAKELAASAPDRTGRIRAAYNFVSALRYVAVEIGVQGFRPRTPATVLANRYGDCKDKANLLAALLSCMEIEAHPAILNRGSSTDVTFPSWQFNHAICLVPKSAAQGQPDDLWLDSTDGVTPFGFPAPGDVDRAALVFYTDAARFQTVALASGAAAASGNTEEWEFLADGAGGWSGTVKSTPSGLLDYERRAGLRGATPRQRRLAIAMLLAQSLPGGDFTAPVWGNPDDLAAPMTLGASVALPSKGRKPAPGAGRWLDPFAEIERGRPMLLNDGQPLRLRQVVRYRFAATPAATLPAPFSVQAGGEALTVSWRAKDAQTWEREAVLDIRQPRIAAADYPAVRRAVEDWAAALQSLPF